MKVVQLALFFAPALLSLMACGSDDKPSTTRGSLTRDVPACDSRNQCGEGDQCYDVTQVTGAPNHFACIHGDPCASVTCVVGVCAIDESAPPAVACVEDG